MNSGLCYAAQNKREKLTVMAPALKALLLLVSLKTFSCDTLTAYRQID